MTQNKYNYFKKKPLRCKLNTHSYVEISSGNYVCKLCGHDFLSGDLK